jgi:hypothetical protein
VSSQDSEGPIHDLQHDIQTAHLSLHLRIQALLMSMITQ